ncbi:unnamed protein product [Notodromas monacha]|uniref:Nudix hydrolase domain-containing protein n=1 Tax=Notodromas monacha TaxID=399045 RepID=A0A7R9GE03_9CRUS|nr:unnamed protein product [Notodromas monacha]CAG0917391.1 unnamed protein product [Notodromas monacha]
MNSSGDENAACDAENSALAGTDIATICSNQKDAFFEEKDAYGGIIVNSRRPEHERILCEELPDIVNASVAKWIEKGIKGVWFKIFLEHTAWIPVLVDNGFVFHHAKSNYAMLVRWLPLELRMGIPNFAHTYIGVGAIVTDGDGHILAVRDKVSFKKRFWKLPGGYVDPVKLVGFADESLSEAAEREVLEETGITAKFETIVAFRHYQHGPFDTADIYFICVLRPLNKIIQKCEVEIEECKWMKVRIDEFMQHPAVSETNRFFIECYLNEKKVGSIGQRTKVIQQWGTLQDLYSVTPPGKTELLT